MTVTTQEAPTPARSPRLRDGWVLGSLALLAALLLVFVPFTRGDWGTRVCVPVINAWDASPPEPSVTDRAAFAAPQAPGVFDTSPAFERVVRYEEWRAGPGACRADSRGRLGAAVGALGAGAAAIVLVRRLTRRTVRARAAAAAVGSSVR